MRVAVLGATSMLAADFVAFGLGTGAPYRFSLFARDPARARAALATRGVSAADCRPLDAFEDGEWDAVLNFVGVGDPARAVAMGASILEVTRAWDDRVLGYLDARPACRYLFLGSGAAFGTRIVGPIGPETRACFDANALPSSAWYGVSKFYAEAVHRARPERSIIDLRVFNYLSPSADLSHRFLVNEMIAAVRDDRVLSVAPGDMRRDYLGQEDFAALVAACLRAPAGYNGAVDAYTRSSISKAEMLDLFRGRFGLRYEVTSGGIDATGAKSDYYSVNRAAEALGYRPRHGSADVLAAVAAEILARS